MTPVEVAAALDATTDLEQQSQLEALEPAILALDDVLGPECADAAISLLERCGHQDDFGFFESIGSYLERCDGAAIGDRLLESARNAPSWKVLMILPGVAGVARALPELRAVQASGAFIARDGRYDASWLAKRIAELEAG